MASSAECSRHAWICSLFRAAWSRRRVEVRSAVRAFIDSVRSARICSVSFAIASLRGAILFSPVMALDIAALLEQTGALLQGHFRLSSGLHSPIYVQCALLL